MRAIPNAATDTLADVLAAHSDFGERHGYLAEPSLKALREAGYLDLWRPRAHGGGEVDPSTLARIVERVAIADTAAAWTMLGASTTWFDLRGASGALVDEILASAASPILCETFNGVMAARPVDGGYRIRGRSAFASGCHWADWIGHTAACGDDFLLVFHPKGQLDIVDDWHVMGLRGTSSNSITADDVFVPSHRVIRLNTTRQPTAAFQTPLYRAPEGLVPVAVVATCLGAWRAALDALSDLAARKTPFASATPLRERSLAQEHFGRALAGYRAARALLHETLDACYERAARGEAARMTDKADLFLAYAFGLQSAREGLDLIARAAGTSGIFETSRICRAVRDVQAISSHAFGAEGRFATAAQAYWGVAVDFPLLAMD